ncbi:protein LAZ1 [Tanacetum coccineum]
MVTSMGICHAKPYTLRGRPSTKLEQRGSQRFRVVDMDSSLGWHYYGKQVPLYWSYAVHGIKIDSHSVRLKVSIWSSILKEVQLIKYLWIRFLVVLASKTYRGWSILTVFGTETVDGGYSLPVVYLVVKDTRLAIDDLVLPSHSEPTRRFCIVFCRWWEIVFPALAFVSEGDEWFLFYRLRVQLKAEKDSNIYLGTHESPPSQAKQEYIDPSWWKQSLETEELNQSTTIDGPQVEELNHINKAEKDMNIYLGPHESPPSQAKQEYINPFWWKQRFKKKLKDTDQRKSGSRRENKMENLRDLMGGSKTNVNASKSSLRDVMSLNLRAESFIEGMECDLLNTTGLFNKKVLDGANRNMIRPDVCTAIHDFFSNGKLLKEINHTFLALIPKVATPLKGFKEVVSENQSAFVPGRRISDNILITQELMHNYHCNRGSPRLDYGMCNFGFILDLHQWDVHGYFKDKRGLRQGDPLSPYLFKLVMEILTLILQRRVRMPETFRYHKHCEELHIINVLFIFGHGDVESARVIMASLDEFKKVSGLIQSIPKSTAFFCNVLNHVKTVILNILPFAEGELPVNYLGVPLISSRILNRDCKVLVEKARNRIRDWKNKSLSFAGRLQLSKVAWDDIFLPKKEGGLGLRSLEVFSPRDITREGYSIHTCVADLIVNGTWNLPLSWLAKAPNLGLVPALALIASRQDCMKWRDTNGTMTNFTVKCAWEALRPRGNEVPWFHIVWFSHSIPRHAFQLWLIMMRSLKTQDKLRQWDVDPATDLTQCSYSSKVWSLLRGLVGMDVVPPVLENIIAWFQPLANKQTVQNIVGKILFAAATYFIWLERNNRLFKRTRRSPEELRDAIVVTVRLKLVTFRFKNKAKVEAVVTKDELQHVAQLCKSEVDSMGRIIARALRALKLEGSFGESAMNQLSNLVKISFLI